MNISKDSYKVLKLFYKNNSLSCEDISDISDDIFNALLDCKYITRDFIGYSNDGRAEYSDYYITDSGKACIQNKSRTEWFKNNWISLFSLLFAFVAALPVIINAVEYILSKLM